MDIHYEKIIKEALEKSKVITEQFRNLQSQGKSVKSYVEGYITTFNEQLNKMDLSNNVLLKKISQFIEEANNSENNRLSELIETFISSAQNLKVYKEYLDSENEKNLDKIVVNITDFILKNEIVDNLSKKIGNEAFIKIISMAVTQAVRVSKAKYQLTVGRIDTTKYKLRLKELYNNYIVQIGQFIKEDIRVQEYIPEVLDFLQGNKYRAILNTTFKIVDRIAERAEKVKSTKKATEKQRQNSEYSELEIQENEKYNNN